MKNISSLTSSLSGILFIIFLACSCSGGEAVDTFSSPKNLYVDFISSYTSGIVSSKSKVKVRLSKPVSKAKAGENISKKLFSFSPSIPGNTYWEDERTLVFEPEKKLDDDTQYKVKLSLDKLFEVPDDRKEFRFVFQVMKQNYEVMMAGMELYNANTLNKVKLSGSLQTADHADNASVEKMLQAKQQGRELEILWDHAQGLNNHRFVIEQVDRAEAEEEVSLSWNGKAINVPQSFTEMVKIPSLKDYKILSTRMVRGTENYISVLFSDPLMERQNLKGLVQIEGSDKAARLVTHLNELKIYPAENVQEEIRLHLYKDIKNAAGFTLENDFRTSIMLVQEKPAVRLSDSFKGVIMPDSEGLILPFEAIGLREVDVTIVRIFEDNILQYLQTNNLGESSELKRVGHPVARKRVALNNAGVVDLHKWNRYTLDLADIMKAEPGAIYQVNINFKKSQSLYYCSGSKSGLEEEEEEVEQDWGFSESSYWDSYESYGNYNWSDRENPCTPSYYRNKSVSKFLFSSNLGLIAKRAEEGQLHVFVSNLINTKPQSEVKVEVYDFQQQLLASGTTTTDGKAILDCPSKPFVLVARQENQLGYLKLTDGSSLSLSNYDVSGQSVKKGLKGYIYGERGVWRPGDSLHLSFILEDKHKTLPDNHPVILELWNAQGKIASRKVQSQSIEGIYSFTMSTDKDAPTGNWQAKVKIGGAEFSKTLKIETVKPNRLKIKLDFGRDRISVLDKEIAGDLHVQWLHGAKAKNLKAAFEVQLAAAKTSFEGYNGFSFDDASKEYYGESQEVFEGRVDSEGYAKVLVSIDAGEKSPGVLKAIFKGKAFEEGGDFSIDQFSIPYYPYHSFVGIKAPEGDQNGLLLTDQDHKLRIATVDATGTAVDRKGLKVELYKLNWRWWWDNSYEDLSSYVGRAYHTPIQEDYISTRNGEGSWTLRINHPDWGRYYVKVTDPESGHSTGQIVALDWPGWANGDKGELDGASMLSFSAEKEEYKVGEKVKISVPSSAGGRALVSLESGSKVLQTFWVETEAKSTQLEFEASAAMSPNVYINISMLQPHAQTFNDLPIRLFGVQSLKVIDPETRLQPLITMPDELQPEQEFTVQVAEKDGKAMAYTLAVVEDGLLDLTRYKTPSPWEIFYAREALGVKTWDMYNDVIGAFGGNIERLLAIGGDQELKPANEKNNNRFKPVVQYLGPFYLKAGEKASHQLNMPQYIGSVRTMVVAAREGAYGSAEATTAVKQPLMVLATLPRVAGPGEELLLPVNIFAMQKGKQQVTVDIKVDGKLALAGPASQTVRFKEAGDQMAYFALKADQALGAAKVMVTAKAGQYTATYDVDLKVRAANPSFISVADTLLLAGSQWSSSYQPLGLKGTNEAVLEISTLPPLNLEQRFQYLIQYPHGCIEQTTSAVFAQLYLDKLTDIEKNRKEEIEKNINGAIKRLKSFQLPSGGMAYWPGNSEVDSWGTNYAGHFLLEAKKKGYHIPEGLLSSWIAYQQQQADNWSPASAPAHEELIQAYRLYTLALAGKPALGAMNRMRERLSTPAAKWRMALAYVYAQQKSEAEKLVENLGAEVVVQEQGAQHTYGSKQRDQAMMLETLIGLERHEQAFEILEELAGHMSQKQNWMSTQSTAYALIAIASYAETHKLSEKPELQLLVDQKEIPFQGDKFVNQVFLPNHEKASQISIKNKGEATVYTRLIRRGVPVSGEEKEESRNIRLQVVYKNMKGEEIDIAGIQQGTDFIADIMVHNTNAGKDYKDLALQQIFPSGWEIINQRLNDTPQFHQQSPATYQDIRDDRVYTYFDLKSNERKAFSVLLNASYQGKYYLPSVAVEAMYDNSIYANKAGRWVEVIQE